MTSAELPLKPTDSAHFPANSATLLARSGLQGKLTEIGRAFFDAKKRTCPLASTDNTAEQRGHLNLPVAGISNVTLQPAHEAVTGNAEETGAAGAAASRGAALYAIGAGCCAILAGVTLTLTDA